MRAATGGDAWNGVGEIGAAGRVTMAGLRGSASAGEDLERGRYAWRFDVPAMGDTADVYDGTTVWAQDVSGGVHPYDTPFARERAVTSAYLARRGYLDTKENARATCATIHTPGGRAAIVVRVAPAGGIPADLAIDSATHLLESVTVELPIPSDDGVMRYADYRSVGGLVLPFSIESGTRSAPADGYAFEVGRYHLLPRARDADFAKPVVRENLRMIGGAASTTVPMRLEGRQLLIWASIDGHATMPFILDTGGHAILTTLAARSLHLQAKGAGTSGGSGAGTISTQYAHVASVRVGDAELLDQSFLVIPYPYSFYERGKKMPLAGILGLEFFERFATRLEYGDRTVTFTPLSRFARSGRGLPLMFEDGEDLPVVEASADGHPGLFETDTGNAGTLILFGDYLARTGLLSRYTGGESVVGHGTGGSNTGRLETLRRFRLGSHALDDVTADFTQMTSGSFASRTEAGNFGFSILSRFIPTFDYANQTLYLDPQHRPTPFGANRSGLRFYKNVPGAFDVLSVAPGSAAAAAGIVAGDRIVAIDGRAASNFSWADLVGLVGKPAGTTLRLRVEHAGATRDVALVLRG